MNYRDVSIGAGLAVLLESGCLRGLWNAIVALIGIGFCIFLGLVAFGYASNAVQYRTIDPNAMSSRATATISTMATRVAVPTATAVAARQSQKASAIEQLKRTGSTQINYTSRTGDFGSYIYVDHVEFAADGIKVYVRAKPYLQTTEYSTIYWKGQCPYNNGPEVRRCHEDSPNVSMDAIRTQISGQEVKNGYLVFDYAVIVPGQRYYLLFGGGFWFDPIYLFTAPS